MLSFVSKQLAVTLTSLSESTFSYLHSVVQKNVSDVGSVVTNFMDGFSKKVHAVKVFSTFKPEIFQTGQPISSIYVSVDVLLLVTCHLIGQYCVWFFGTETCFVENADNCLFLRTVLIIRLNCFQKILSNFFYHRLNYQVSTCKSLLINDFMWKLALHRKLFGPIKPK